ncbi:hypothetical protein Ddye_023834 [Dipteronia dyeriana]|uniref:Peptidase S8/S53 domain-containing protein n=1 Tax=Dipteronia dyeriana TaxID=168575 RepID=A0AAD9TTR7_9ROSI|nr:hypothetical protein Ddye_023834 [Dipteronia dyeriana]
MGSLQEREYPPASQHLTMLQEVVGSGKIIGARYYNISGTSARDEDGHGSHTASTAGGNSVKDASFYRMAKGIATGGVPSARIAVYKACDAEGCQIADILSAFDDAIADGVDLITISIGIPILLKFMRIPFNLALFSFLFSCYVERNPDRSIMQSELVTITPTVSFPASAPDISAPGVNILAAFSPIAEISPDPLDKRKVKYTIMSGTSMSCLHVTCVAAYVKTFHPD